MTDPRLTQCSVSPEGITPESYVSAYTTKPYGWGDGPGETLSPAECTDGLSRLLSHAAAPVSPLLQLIQSAAGSVEPFGSVAW